ncbi:MAG: terpene cyclase/mutase family protein [Lentisphaerae bacterium]|nr:terpene cyclase/mutase family protein [Lentisphaerota bacterium]
MIQRKGFRFRGVGLKCAVLALVVGLLFPVSLPAEEAGSGDRAHLDRISKNDKVDEAVEKALAYLATQQDETDGHFKGDKPNALTALSCLAYMATGHFPGRSPYGDNLRRGMLYLAKASKKHNGYYGNESNARMYGHGICAVAMSEAYGMLQDEEENLKLKAAIEAAIKVILHSQAKSGVKQGGWRYSPSPGDADLSVTAWQILALRSAQNCQLEVPQKAIDDATDYLRRSYHVGGKGFAYTPGGGPSVAMKSAGVVCMLALGANKTDADKSMIRGSAEYLLTMNPTSGGSFFYQSYYVATAANMMGKKHREAILPKLEKFLLTLQSPSGEFRNHGGAQGGVYSTAFSVICLCVGYQYLPIYQE